MLEFEKFITDFNSTKQRFALPNQHNNFSKVPNLYQTVLELKFEADDWEASEEIRKFIPFRQTKFSKYVKGVSELYL